MLQTWIATERSAGRRFVDLDGVFYEVAEAAEAAGGVWLKRLTLAATVIANAMAAQAAVSRVLFAMARDRKLPAALARLHPRFDTPYVSTIVVGVVSLAVGLVFADRLEDLTRLVNFGALCGFLLLHVVVVNHFVVRGGSRDWVRYVIAPLLGFTIIAFVVVEMDRLALTFGSVWLARRRGLPGAHQNPEAVGEAGSLTTTKYRTVRLPLDKRPMDAAGDARPPP